MWCWKIHETILVVCCLFCDANYCGFAVERTTTTSARKHCKDCWFMVGFSHTYQQHSQSIHSKRYIVRTTHILTQRTHTIKRAGVSLIADTLWLKREKPVGSLSETRFACSPLVLHPAHPYSPIAFIMRFINNEMPLRSLASTHGMK